MPALKGNFAALEDLQRRLRELASPKLKEEIAHALAGDAIKLLADEFRESRNPYGEPWAPVVRNRGRDVRARARRARAGKAPRADRPLIDTGRLRAAATATSADGSSGATVRVTIPVEYASYHQDGTRRIRRRQIVPDRAGGLGPIWSARFEKTIKAKLAAAVGKR